MNYLQRKRMALMMAANNGKPKINTVSGYPVTITDSAGKNIIALDIYGNVMQDENVSIGNPSEVYGVGDKTVNLFDISKVSESSGIKRNGNTLSLSAYSCPTSITPSKFLAMTGLSPGDTIRISRKYELVKGTENTATARMAFIGKNGVTDFVLITNKSLSTTKIIPENFNNDNYLGMYIYGAYQADSNGDRLVTMSDIQITKGSESHEYEPYGAYKIPIEVTGSATNILPIDTPLYSVGGHNDELSLDFGRKTAVLTRRVQKMVIDGSTVLRGEYFPRIAILHACGLEKGSQVYKKAYYGSDRK